MDTLNTDGPAVDNGLPGKPVSLWLATTPETDFPAMPQDISVDVAVIGGGIAGIATALLLKQEGRTVAVIEAGRVVERVTGNTTAKVTALHRLVYDHLISQFGEDGARQYADAQTAAIVNFDGRVRQGPANKDLEPVELKTEGDGPSE